MNFPVDDWHDWVRLCSLIMSGLSFIKITCSYFKRRDGWSRGSREEWGLWAGLTGSFCFFSYYGISHNAPFSAGPVLIFLLSLVILFMVFVQGRWSPNDSKIVYRTAEF